MLTHLVLNEDESIIKSVNGKELNNLTEFLNEYFIHEEKILEENKITSFDKDRNLIMKKGGKKLFI